VIKKNESLSRHIWAAVEDVKADQVQTHQLNTRSYKLIAGDLRETDMLAEKFNSTGVDSSAPTLILTECVLIYLKPDESKKILSFIKEHFKCDAAILNYEMINP
jgi:[phosphatase 2A protein]-leucine-carboxy methyltransferase